MATAYLNSANLMKEFHFCTSLALGGVPKLIALLNSLNVHIEEKYHLWVLCENDATVDAIALLGRKNVSLVKLIDIEVKYPILLDVKLKRDAFEYNCTLRPAWIRYVLDFSIDIPHVTYLDTDLYFFSDPSPIYEDLDRNSVLLSPHRLSRLASFMGISETIVGSFNAGWIVFKNDTDARSVLEWWHLRCIEWCYRRPVFGKFGEQKYLDEFFKISPKVGVVTHKGVNLAPWNINNYSISVGIRNEVLVDEVPLVFFHFHALKIEGEASFKVERELGSDCLQLTNPSYVIPEAAIKLIYQPYINELRSSVLELEVNGVSAQVVNRKESSIVRTWFRVKSRLLNVLALVVLKVMC